MKSVSGEKAHNEPTIIYEDDDVLVVNKPEGWIVHDDGRVNASPVLVDWFLARVPQAAGVGEPAHTSDGKELNRSGVVHRLDRETSGILIMAKTQEAYEHLKKQFKDRTVLKEYHAFVYGRIHDRWATINRAIGRSSKDSRLRSAMKGAKGIMREAVTDVERIGVGEYKDEAFSYVKLVPKTGRTHQLRAHLRAIDRPIVGDKLYAVHILDKSNNLEMGRMALHAHVLELELPNGSRERFIAPLPQDFDAAAERIAE